MRCLHMTAAIWRQEKLTKVFRTVAHGAFVLGTLVLGTLSAHAVPSHKKTAHAKAHPAVVSHGHGRTRAGVKRAAAASSSKTARGRHGRIVAHHFVERFTVSSFADNLP